MPFDAQVKRENQADQNNASPSLFCKTCQCKITQPNQQIAMRGDHEHTVFNRAGELFTIGCFSTATGCIETGRASTEFSWFPGYSWKIARCTNCGIQMGWQFSGKAPVNTFYGLILNRLTDNR